jgi:hypothetical protein
VNDLPTLRAESWFELWRVLQFLEVVIVGGVPNVHLSFEGIEAFLAVFPVAFMPFIVMIPAESIMVMVPVAAVPPIRERDILIMVIAYPIPAAFRFSQLSSLAAKATARFLALLGRFSWHLLPPRKEYGFGRDSSLSFFRFAIWTTTESGNHDNATGMVWITADFAVNR